ncbi:uncharacterized protein CTRU02_210305 [Colletotrichum truncatum]|uniref:Uncharacterized protein n=1 Tax=Colletotrichum truncatum TaxID=5467 RepID=A0ACC3YUV6_COLTU
MAFMPLAFETRSDTTTRLSYTRSSLSPANQMDTRMPSSRGNTSPHGFNTGHAVLSPRDRLSPKLQDWPPSRAMHSDFYSASSAFGHLTKERFHSTSPRPQKTSDASQDRRKSKPKSPKRRRNPDHSLLAIGSWSNQSHHHETNHSHANRFGDHVTFNDQAAANDLPMGYSASFNETDDFVLFPDDTPEDELVPYGRPLPPRAPRISRLRTPDIAPLSTDVQFFPCLGDECEEDRINEAWYLAGRETVDSQRQFHSMIS